MAGKLAVLRAAYVRRRPPAGVRMAVRSGGDGAERVLSWAPGEDGLVLAVTNRGLWEVRAEGATRIDFHDIDRATWTIPLLGVEPTGDAARSYRLQDPGSVPRDVRTRVEASVALTRRHRLGEPGSKASVRVVARRSSTGGPLLWRLAWDDRDQAADPALLAEAEALLESTRRSGEV